MGRRSQKQGKQKSLSSFENFDLSCEYSGVFGRHLICRRPFTKGDIILKEKWIIAGPNRESWTPVCIGCHSQLSQINATQCDGGCNWLVCNSACAHQSPFHTSRECQFFKENGIKPILHSEKIDYGILLVLRGILLKIWNNEAWIRLNMLQSHNEIRKNLKIWQNDKILVNYIRKSWKLHTLFSADEIFNVCGIIDTNSFEMGDGWSFCGIFFQSSMLMHNCCPNAAQSENIEEGCLEVVGISNMSAQTPLSICYDGALEGTRPRQKLLEKSKYFHCTCNRCEDPTELGTHFSSMFCKQCQRGYLIRANKEDELTWICTKCSHTMSDDAVDRVCAEMKKLGNSMDSTIQSKEEFLKKCDGILHPNHYIQFRTKFNLCLAYGREPGFELHKLDSAQMNRKYDLCQSLLRVVDVICPGGSVARGNILYELQGAQVTLVRHFMGNEKASKGMLRKKLEAGLSALDEAIQIFHCHYSLRLLATSAQDVTRKELQEIIQSL